jgi:hypothetical protein
LLGKVYSNTWLPFPILCQPCKKVNYKIGMLDKCVQSVAALVDKKKNNFIGYISPSRPEILVVMSEFFGGDKIKRQRDKRSC